MPICITEVFILSISCCNKKRKIIGRTTINRINVTMAKKMLVEVLRKQSLRVSVSVTFFFPGVIRTAERVILQKTINAWVTLLTINEIENSI